MPAQIQIPKRNVVGEARSPAELNFDASHARSKGHLTLENRLSWPSVLGTWYMLRTQVNTSAEASKSGVYWGWNGGAQTVGYINMNKGYVVGAGGAGGDIFENTPSGDVQNKPLREGMYELSEGLVAPWMSSGPGLPQMKVPSLLGSR